MNLFIAILKLIALFIVAYFIYGMGYIVLTKICFASLLKFKKNLSYQKEFFLVFLISIFTLLSNAYIPMELSSEIITIFVFIPTIFFYSTQEKIIVMKSSLKILFYILFIKLFLNKDFLFSNDIIASLYFFFKASVFSNLYFELIKVLLIVLSYLQNNEDNK
ncbi:hypothetical protein [uncultured Fusobacterium sp.]|uniref:hypothetical protein n=1 Tax=uncultured Fusobacterium sp. TaxID=159267 RepID=UPI0025F59030|nr:hypothetical protein [uncultured Fusobacterium sp.]